jgi:FtsH-binding integral membrane protein
MPASSNFQQAIREAQSSALVGPNVVNKALPYVGGGMVLTSLGVLGGLTLIATPIFMPLFWVALIGNLILFFVAQNVAMKGNNATALPLLAVYSLITGFTLSGLVAFAGAVAGVGAGWYCRVSDRDHVCDRLGRWSSHERQRRPGPIGCRWSRVDRPDFGDGRQFVGGIFAPAMFHGTSFELMIAGFGTVLFVGAAFVDFYTMPRAYRDDQYLAGALSMYLTYINLFIFILRLIIVLNGGGRRD